MGSQETKNALRRNAFDWDDLQIFHAVATTGSMNAAAAALGMQQPTVSKRMKQLEVRLGSVLVERHVEGITLTPAGESALDYVLTMQRSAKQLEAQLGGLDREVKGDVTLRVSDGLASYWMSRSLPEFLRVNPEVNLHLYRGDLGGNGGPADLSITFLPEKDMEMRAESLGALHYMPFASREFINTYGAPKNQHEAAGLRFMKMVSWQREHELWADRVGAVDAYIDYSLRTDVSSVLFETLRHGGGVAMAPTYLAALYPDELVVLDYDFKQSVRFWLKYQPESAKAARVKRVGSWVKECFNRQYQPWFREEFVHPREFSEIEIVSARD
jgi:DNA-binding transcriptional LysR family regulator